MNSEIRNHMIEVRDTSRFWKSRCYPAEKTPTRTSYTGIM